MCSCSATRMQFPTSWKYWTRHRQRTTFCWSQRIRELWQLSIGRCARTRLDVSLARVPGRSGAALSRASGRGSQPRPAARARPAGIAQLQGLDCAGCSGRVEAMRYDQTASAPTGAGRGNPRCKGARWPRYVLLRPFRAHRLRTSMAAPGGASFGWAGLPLRPVFHPRLCAAALNQHRRHEPPPAGRWMPW